MKTLLLMLVTWPLAASANTFVGNGGGAGDVELAVTKKQIEETFRAIQKREKDGENEMDLDGEETNFCKCNRAYANRSVCEPVRALNAEEQKYCSQVLRARSGEILKLVGAATAVRFRWTDEPIRVNEGKTVRAVDAVTDPAKREITLNLKRFLELKSFERVFLVTHELFHLVEIEGKPAADEGPVGPFAGEEGGRRLLNALGASAAMLQGEYPAEIKTYRARLNRSQSWKRFWLGVDLGQTDAGSKPEGTFSSRDFQRLRLSARYVLGDFVLGVSYRNESSKKKALQTVDVAERREIFSVGAGYRFFFFGDPQTFWGQSHLLAQINADYVRSDLKLTETFEISDKAEVWGGGAELSYHLPIFWGLWGYVGVGYEIAPYKYKNINVKYDSHFFSQYLGVSYAF